MPDFEQSLTVATSPDRVYAYVADVRNLPRYFAHMTQAEPRGGDVVEVSADVHGQTEQSEAWFRTDEAERRITWGSRNDDGYEGWLQVCPEGQDYATVIVHLHTPDAMPSDSIEGDLRRSLEAIRTASLG
ncbi:MAG: SRPBCC family protein [Actinomycetes bacterium]